MIKQQLAAKLEIRLYEYFQPEKVAQLYNQIVERAEKSSSKNRESEKSKGIKGEVGLGELLTQLGIKASAAGDAQSKSLASEEITYELTPEKKLQIVWEYLFTAGQVVDLNARLKKGEMIFTSAILVMFEGKNSRFELVDPKSDPHQGSTLIRVRCAVEEYDTEFFCSREYFSGSALIFDIQEKIERDIYGIAAIKAIDRNHKKISLNPIAF